MLAAAVILLLCVSGTQAHASGAGSEACSDLVPQHGYLAKPDPSPYEVIAPDQYSPGSKIQGTCGA